MTNEVDVVETVHGESVTMGYHTLCLGNMNGQAETQGITTKKSGGGGGGREDWKSKVGCVL